MLFDTWLVSRSASAAIDAAIREVGLDADEFAIYSVLVSGDGLTPTELAQWMAAPATTVSSYVKRFEARGHVERIANPEDRRSYRVRLTEEGQNTHRAAGVRFLPLLTEVEALLADDVIGLHQGLHRLRGAIAIAVEGSEGHGLR